MPQQLVIVNSEALNADRLDKMNVPLTGYQEIRRSLWDPWLQLSIAIFHEFIAI